MLSQFIRCALVIFLLLALQACQDKTTEGPGEAGVEPAATPVVETPADVFAPKGMNEATVVVRIAGKAEVTSVDGYPGLVTRVAGNSPYRRIMLPPGEHVLTVSHVGSDSGANLRFAAEPGEYYAAGFDYFFQGEKFWAPVIVRDKPDGTIVADKDGDLVGRSVADARIFIVSKLAETARSSAPAPQDNTPSAVTDKAEMAEIFESGRSLYEAKKFSEALGKFDEVLQSMPDLDVAHLYRGLTLIGLKRNEEALAALDAALAAGSKTRQPGDAWFALPNYQRARLLMAQRQPEAAEKALDASIAARPTALALTGRARLYLGRGQALGKQEKWDAAEPWFRKAQADAATGLQIEPGNAKMWSLKSTTHIMLNEHEDACVSMRKACELGDCTLMDQFPQCKPGGS